jgi:hypothetical protein
MSNSGCRYSDKLGSVSVDHSSVAGLWGRCLVASEGNALDGRPLLDLLKKVPVKDQVIRGAMPGLEPRERAAVAWIHSLDLISPLLSSLDDLPIRAHTIGADWARSRRPGHASGSNARVACSSGESVRVRRGEHIGHHASGAGTRDKDLLGVGLVRLDHIVDHADEDLAITLAVVLERLGAGDIPAVEVLLGGREDKDDAAGVSERLVLGLLEIAGSVATAGVQLISAPSAQAMMGMMCITHGEHDCWASREVSGDVGLHS